MCITILMTVNRVYDPLNRLTFLEISGHQFEWTANFDQVVSHLHHLWFRSISSLTWHPQNCVGDSTLGVQLQIGGYMLSIYNGQYMMAAYLHAPCKYKFCNHLCITDPDLIGHNQLVHPHICQFNLDIKCFSSSQSVCGHYGNIAHLLYGVTLWQVTLMQAC